ncbi:MAG: hypothetical protein KDA45_12830 [Planctomycetales bacterium]|nr:hypothetical protein [Planctomycetales bacterium]
MLDLRQLTASPLARPLWLCLWGLAMYWATSVPLPAQSSGTIEIDFREEQSGAPLACRLRILGANGKPQRGRGTLYQQGWNLAEGPLLFRGRPGDYTYQAFHGPEFAAASGGFTLDRKSQGQDVVSLPRHAQLSLENWFAADLLSYVPAEESLRWLAAEELALAAVIAGVQLVEDGQEPPPAELRQAHRWVHHSSYHDARPGSGLLLHHWSPPAAVPASLPSSRLLVLAKNAPRQAGELPVHAEIQQLWARDLPIWLASGRIDSIQVLSEHLTYDGQENAGFTPLVDPAPGRFRGPRRMGRLVEYLYWQVLETGLRIPPSAGSGFGRSGSPLGYNRVYAFTPSLTAESWWRALRQGQAFVSNGPLLRATVNDQLPGHVFTASSAPSLSIDIALKLTVADPVEYLDVIFNGNTLYQARLDEFARQGGKIPLQTIAESGWLVVRVVTERDHTYRLASTAPYYFQIGDRPRVSRRAVRFFQAWLQQAAEQIAALDPASRDAAEPYLQAAQEFWRQREMLCTAE